MKSIWNPTTKDLVKKYVAYRIPPIRDLVFPRYRYGIDPAQLAFLVNGIESTKETGGAVLEIGVSWGHTSVFLLEHLRSTQSQQPVVLIDTFEGFVESSMRYEVVHRGKRRSDIDRFRYCSPTIFEHNLRRLGYDNFKIIVGDCCEVDYEAIGPIAVALLDVDLYMPTKYTLDKLWPHIASGGSVLVDDCIQGTEWDGSLQAYSEFIKSHDMPFVRVGSKGGAIIKCR